MPSTNLKTVYVFAAICCCLMLSACGNESAAKKATLAVLKDPDSAKFGSFSQEGDKACLTVNARNAMGGYVGNKEVSLEKTNGVWEVNDIADISHESCERAMIKAKASKKIHSEFCENLKKSMADPNLKDGKETFQKLYALDNCSN